jgi:hypothetical protein
MCGGVGSVLTQHRSHDRKLTVNVTLATGNQAEPAHCYKFHILQKILQYTIVYNIILGPGKAT